MTTTGPRAGGDAAPGETTGHTGRTVVAPGGGRPVAVLWGMLRVTRRATDALSRAARRIARSLRPAGVVALVVAVGGAGGASAFGWIEWAVASVAATVLLLLAVPFLVGVRAYRVELVLPEGRLVAGDTLHGTIAVTHRGRTAVLPGRIELPIGAEVVVVDVPLLRPGRRLHRPLTLTDLPRGILPVGPAVTVRADPLGLLRREHAVAEVRELCVHPRTIDLPGTSAGLVRDLEGAATRELVDADIAFHAIREYVPGDSRRQIHWKSTAKTGRLMVRQYEQTRRSRTAVVLAAGPADVRGVEDFELAVSCAASLAVRAVRDAREVDVVVGAEVPRAVRGRVRAIERLPVVTPRALLDACSAVQPRPEAMPIEEVCRLVGESTPSLSVVFLVVGGPVTPSRVRRAALGLPPDAAAVAVVCEPGASPRARAVGALTVLTVGALVDLPGLLLRGAAS